MITRASVQGWDNSSRGLDASTALEYVQSIRTLTNMAHTSTAVSLYQAGESLYQLVDKVLLIDQGKCLYFGSADSAKQYFLDLGFACPDRWTTADFLTSVTDEHERSIREGWEDRIPRNADEFAAMYRQSEVYQRNLADIRDFEAHLEEQRRERLQNESKKSKQKNYTVSFYKQVMACTHRQFLVMIGDRASLIGKWGGIVFQVCFGTTNMVSSFSDILAGPYCRELVLSNASDNCRRISSRWRDLFRSPVQRSIGTGRNDRRVLFETDSLEAQVILLLPTCSLRHRTDCC